MKKIWISSLLLMGGSLLVFAGGYRVSLQGVKQASMAHTSAHTDDASVMFFNPAGLGFVDSKISLAAGVFALKPDATFQDTRFLTEESTDNDFGTPFYFAGSYRILEDITLGLSVTTPFGNTVNWGENWSNRATVQDIELAAIFFQPTVAVRFNEWFSAGFGFIFATGNLTLNRAIPTLDGSLTLEDKDASGTGFNIGAYFRPSEKVDISLAYRSNVNMEAKDGDATFNVSPLLGLVNNDTFDATLPLVSEFTVGISYKPIQKLTLSGDVNFVGWQKYKRLNIDFGQNPVGNDPNDPTLSTTPKEFSETINYRFGVEYMAMDNLAVRVGYYHDENPVSDAYWSPETPTLDYNGYTFGLGYSWSRLTIDAYAAYVKGVERAVNNTNINMVGNFNANVPIFGLGLSYNIN